MNIHPRSCCQWLNRVARLAVHVLSLVSFAAAAAPAGRQTLMYQGIERSYVVRLTGAMRTSDQRWPLVLVLHGGAGDAATIETATGFTDKASREGFIVVYLQTTQWMPDASTPLACRTAA